MTLRGATARQRQPFLMHSFRYFSNKKVEIAIFCLGYQTRSIVEAQKSPLHVSFFDIRTSIVSFLVLSAGKVETDETENGNGKLKRKTETESGNGKAEIWKWSSNSIGLYQDSVHTGV